MILRLHVPTGFIDLIGLDSCSTASRGSRCLRSRHLKRPSWSRINLEIYAAIHGKVISYGIYLADYIPRVTPGARLFLSISTGESTTPCYYESRLAVFAAYC